MDAVAALEAALEEAADREQLAVYADALEARGDPRGELIALDLHVEARGSSLELDARRDELMVRWLGETLAHDPAIRHARGGLEVTLVDGTIANDDRVLAKVFDVAARMKLTIHAAGERLEAALAHVTLATRPRLTHLVLKQLGREPAIPRKLAGALIDATPNLRELDIDGRIFGGFPHPTLRRLRVSGYTALTLSGANLSLPAVTELDLKLVTGRERLTNEPTERVALAALLPSAGLPSLRVLDLTRNEPSVTFTPRGEVSIFRFLRELPIRRHLTHVRLPAMRAEGDIANTQAALETMPELVELWVARVFGSLGATFRHPSARLLVPPAVPWPPRDAAAGTIEVEIPGIGPEQVELVKAVELMELAYHGLSELERTAWDHVWRAFGELVAARAAEAPPYVRFPLRVFETALSACAQPLVDHAFARSRWLQLCVILRERRHVAAEDEMVVLRRVP